MYNDNDNVTTLNKLKRGTMARIVDIDFSDTVLVSKFAARGLVPGAELAIVRGGDPLLLSIEESRWAVTGSEAAKVCVETLGKQRSKFKRWFNP